MSKSKKLVLGMTLLVLALTAVVWVGCEMGRRDLTGPKEPGLRDVSRSTITFGVDEVKQIQNRHTNRLLAIDNVVGTATTKLADGTFAIKILVKKSDAESQLPQVLDGVPVVVAEVGEIVAEAAPTDRIRPVACGVSGHNIGLRPPGPNGAVCFMGTIGCVVEKGGTNYFLSCNHVFARSNRGRPGEEITQPSPGDHEVVCAQDPNDVVANLSDFCPIKWNPLRNSNTIDAAIAEIKPGVDFTCAMLDDYFTPSSTPAEPFIGLAIKKCGRTTGLTFGEVTDVNVTIIVSYSPDGHARFENQIGYMGMTSSGDSGSLIVTQDGNHPIALHFAGSSSTGAGYGCPIQDILDYFGVTICSN